MDGGGGEGVGHSHGNVNVKDPTLFLIMIISLQHWPRNLYSFPLDIPPAQISRS